MKNNLYELFSDRWVCENGSIWIYSDPHFGDLDSYKLRHTTDMMLVDGKKCYQTGGNIWEDEESLKCSMECFDEWQIKNINSKCGKNDTLIILGDVGDIKYVKKLKARYKILIMGNHDKGASNYKRQVVNYIITLDKDKEFESSDVIKQYSNFICIKYLHHDEIYRYEFDNHLFDEVYEGPLMINDRVILSHEPIMGYGNYLFNIHGHVHNVNHQGDQTHLNCCAEAINYKPLNLLKLLRNGLLKDIDNIHRQTIDIAIKNKRKKNFKEIDKKLKELYNK